MLLRMRSVLRHRRGEVTWRVGKIHLQSYLGKYLGMRLRNAGEGLNPNCRKKEYVTSSSYPTGSEGLHGMDVARSLLDSGLLSGKYFRRHGLLCNQDAKAASTYTCTHIAMACLAVHE
jgi:hypothetical protein